VLLTISPPSVRVGAQRPRLLSVPPRVSSAGAEAIALAASAGLHLDPWQQLVLTEALGEKPDGRWAAFEVGLVVPRQNGKGSVLEALELAALFLPDPDAPPPLILHSAHEFKTSAEHFRRMRDLIDSSPQLSSRVRIVRTAAGSEAIELHSGSRLRFVTRTGGSGRGFSADLIVIDEAYNLTAEAMAAVLPTMSARPNPQVWYTSSAGMTSSDQLERVRERGMRGGDPSLAYFEWSAEPDADLDDPLVWASANPALGIRIPEHFVHAERAALPDDQFARERCGIWQSKDRRDGALDADLWATLADPGAARGNAPCFAVATAPDRSWSAVGVAWRRPDGRVQVMLADYKPHTTWVAERVREVRETWGGRVVVDNASRGLVEGAEEPSVALQAAAHNALSDAVLGDAVRHGNEPALNYAVKSARWRPSGDTRVLDRKGTADISPLIAVALAMHGLSSAETSTTGWVMAL
jgi:hypothetical protein